MAFSAHPRIGGSVEALRDKFAKSAAPATTASDHSWEGEEQSGTKHADENVLRGLLAGNQEYEAKFGHVFLICATGKTAEEMLAALEQRKINSLDQEILIAAGEQAKIAQLRISKLLASLEPQSPSRL